MVLLCFALAWLILGAWEEGKAQAGAEWRRAREHVKGEFAARLEAGQAASPWQDPFWWIGAAVRSWRSMRGLRQGAQRAAQPAKTAWGRIGQAAFAGAARGAAKGAGRARGRRQVRREARNAAGGSRTGKAGRKAASAAGFAAGWAAGRASWRGFWQKLAAPVGVCDKCGAVCALPSMAYQKVDAGGRAETWLLCALCRTGKSADDTPPRAPLPVTVGHPSDGPEAVRQADGDAEEPGGAPEPQRAGPADLGRYLREPSGDAPAAVEPSSADDGEAAPTLPAADEPGGELPAGDSPTETSPSDGGQVPSDLELPDARLPAARPDESYSYGSWQRATTSDAELLDQLALALEAMLSDLTAATAGRTQVRNVADWADRVGVEAALTREAIKEMDRRYEPVISAVDGAGGPEEVSNTSYYREY